MGLNNTSPLVVASRHSLRFVEMLVEHGTEVSPREKQCNALLSNALESANPAIIRWAVQHGADVNAKDTYGKTLLQYLQGRMHIGSNAIQLARTQQMIATLKSLGAHE